MRRSLLVVTIALFAAACGDNSKPPAGPGGPGDQDKPHGSPPAVEMTCETLPPSESTCTVTKGSTTTLFKGNVLTSTTLYKGGQVAVDPTGKIACVGCNCATTGETTIVCPGASISPGLINTHDHITFTHNDPYLPTGEHAAERYENRHQWRLGRDGHYEIPYKSSASDDQIRWGELRFVMGGATSIVGAGSTPGLLRNLDELLGDQEGLGHKAVDFDTFPLADSGRTAPQQTDNCDYGTGARTEAAIARFDAYEPHTSEGIDAYSRNEFLCQSSSTYDTTGAGISHNLLQSKTAMIHAVGLLAEDYQAMATANTGLIWSPRSNITLYGETARVTTASRYGVEIALGTDWMPSGSMNMLRELACADYFNQTHLDKYFTDQELWEMVTLNAASVTATEASLGVLAPGRQADIAIFAARGKSPFRAVIEAEPKDVALVMRGGTILYGDDAVVAAAVDPAAPACDTVDVCGTPKRVCTLSQVGKTYDALKDSAKSYPAFQCGVPPSEPTCVPSRPLSVAGSSVYTGVPSDTDSDGDGLANDDDNCPRVFNPIRPLDNGVQGDADDDGRGDACDPCPTNGGTIQCEVAEYLDRDGDGRPNVIDNCINLENANQADADKDGKGDVCDACPDAANPGVAGCASTIYEVKNGTSPLGRGVRIENALITGRASNGFFVQVKETDAGYVGADNSGLFVFTSSAPPAKAVVGSRVTVDGTVTLFSGEIEIDSVLNLIVTSTATEPPPLPVAVSYADIKTGGPRAAALEGVIVTVGLGQVSLIDAMFPPEFTLTDAAGDSLIVDDLLFRATVPPLNQELRSVTGVLAFRNNASKLEPRSAADLVLGRPGLKALAPALSFARAGVTTNAPTFPVPLTVSLIAPSQGDTTVTVTSSNSQLLSVADVVIPDGATSAVVPVTAIAQAPDVTITATLRGNTSTARVRVLDAAEVPATVTLAPQTLTISPNSNVTLTANLDLPAEAPKVIALALDPPDAGTLPATVTVLDNQTSVSFNFANTTASGTVRVTATFLASTSTSTLTVSNAIGNMVISQVYGGGGNAGATLKNDFIELHNPTSSALSLNGMSVQYTSATGSGTWTVTALPDVTVQPGAFFLIEEAKGNGGTADLPTPDLPGGLIAMGGTAGKVALVSNATALMGACPTVGVVDLIGYGATATCSETAPTAVLTNTTSAQRNGTGCTDTNNNLADFTLALAAPRNSSTVFACP